MAVITFYYDVVCPYAYLGSTRARALAERTGAQLVYRPILLGGVSRQDVNEPVRAPHKSRDCLSI